MSQIDKVRNKIREIQEDDLDVVFQRYPIKVPTHPTTTFKELVEDAAAAALLKAKQADQIQKQKDKHEKEAEALKDRHERENDRQKGLDAKEVEDDAIRKQREADRKASEAERKNASEELEETPLVIPNEVQADKMIADKMLDMLRKSSWNKKVKLAKEFGIKLSKRGKAYQIETRADNIKFVREFHDKMPEKIRVRMLQHFNKLMDLPYGSIAFKKEKDEMEKLQKKYSVKREKVEESFSRTLVNKAIELVKSPKYFQGNYTGAVKAIEKLKKGLSDDSRVRAALQTANEEWEKLEEKSTIIPLEIPMFGFMYDIRKELVGWAKRAGLNPKMIGKGPKELLHLKGTPSQINKFINMIPTEVKPSKNVTERIRPKATDWEGRASISKNVRKDFWKSLKKMKKEELEKTFKTWEVEEDRNYKKEYENYHGKKEQIARRSKRNEARRSLKNRKDIEGKDVHHKDNNPMNNDKSNLSIVSQHFNRREPRLREGVDGDAMIDLMQKYLLSKNKKEKKTLLKQINRYQKKLGLKVTEELGKGATQQDYIDDFLKSDAPQFVGQTKKKVIQMAVAAFKTNK